MLNSLLAAKLNPRVACLILIASALLPFFLAAVLPGQTLAADGLTVARLRCEGLSDPLGIQEPQPRLSWIVESDVRGQKQTAYQLVVASDQLGLAALHADLWDSGKVASDKTSLIPYAGKPLLSRTRCYWKVRVWDKDGVESAWSPVARWSIGLLNADDWSAQWISYRDRLPLHADRNNLFLPPARMYRKDFTAAKPVVRATLYASALGLYEMKVNGRPVTDALLTPGWSDYRKRVYYNTYDVTSLVNPGGNAMGATVTEGWYSGYVGYGLLVGYGPNKCGRAFYGKTPALLAQLELEYADGSRATVITDNTWSVTDRNAVREADIIMGERHERFDLGNWTSAGYHDEGWESAIRAEENGSTKAVFTDVMGDRKVELGFVKPPIMQAYPGPPIRATQELKTVAITEPAPGVYIFDMGQNFAGVVRLKVRGQGGQVVQIRYGEMLHPDGRLMTENLRKARATDFYAMLGDPAGETWTPHFTYHGFRYVELTGLAAKPMFDTVTGIVIGSDTPLVSTFECSDPMVNRLFQNIVWTQRANFVEIPTDCPQRDERLGWMGDAQIYVRAATCNADAMAFYTKWMDDVEEAQRDSGAYPDYCPYPMAHGQRGKDFGTAWMDAGIICPWTMWKVYGDTRIIQRHYASMTRFMDFRKTSSPKNVGVSIGNPWGDWLSVNEVTPVEYIDACYYARCAELMADMAGAIGRADDAQKYARLLGDIKATFNAAYVKPDGTVKVETQTAYVLALSFNLLPDNLISPAADHLAGMIERNGFRMATGFLGTKPLLPVLSATGHHDLAVRLFQSRKFPSWGYEVENGATTVWERWDSYTREDAFGKHNAAMNSFSHYAFGAVCEWMFRDLAGIDTDGEGFHQIRIRPRPPQPGSNPDNKPIDWVRASYDGPTGKIASAWKREGDRFELDVTIPANTTATVLLPAASADAITESGKPVRAAACVQIGEPSGGRVSLKIGSGRYQFVSALPSAGSR